ncbi:hypothetical protein Tco_1335148 [Tanacetum coccineum]
MLTLAKNVIVAWADNRPLMLDKTQYSSWASRMLLYIRGKENGKLFVDSVLNGPFKYGTVTVPDTQTTHATARDRTYDELTNAEKIRESCDIKETNIILQGLPQDIYNLVNHHTEAKDIWDRVKLLIEGSEISLQKRESKFYDEFDMFTSVPGETIHTYYLRFDKEKAMLAEALESRVALDEEQMAFLADNEDTVTLGQASQELVNTAAFQTNDLDAFDSDCDEAPSANVVLMAKLSAYDSEVLSEVPTHDIYLDNHVNDQIVELERYKEQIKLFEQRQNYDLNDREKYLDSQLRKVLVDRKAKVADFQNQIHSLKLQLSATIESHKTLSTMVDALKMESKAKEDKYLKEIIELDRKRKLMWFKKWTVNANDAYVNKTSCFYDEAHKTALGYQNPLYLTQAQKKVHSLYFGNTIVRQHDALSVIDTGETLELAKESRLKMHAKQNDPIAKEKEVNIAPIDYDALNRLFEHFVKHFVPQKQLFAQQAFWLPILKPVSEIPPVQTKPVLKEIPCKLPTISLVKDSFNIMRSHVNDFENVVTVRTKYFHMIGQGLHKEITDMKEVFTQMETEVAKCSIERKTFKIKEKELIIENDRLLEHIICQDVMSVLMHANVENVVPAYNNSLECDNLEAKLLKKENGRFLELIISQDLVHTAVNSLAEIVDYQNMEKSYLNEYAECVQLQAELSKKNETVEKAVYNELSK